MRRTAPILAAALFLAACGDPDDPDPHPDDRDRDGILDASDCAPDDASRWELGDAWRDADGDGVGAGDVTTGCRGSSPPEGHALIDGDCDDTAADRHQTYAYAFRDADHDGRYVAEAGEVCAPALPDGYALTDPGAEPDCDDGDAARFRVVDLFVDVDFDDVGAGVAAPQCIGDPIPNGWALVDGDCAVDDAARWQILAYTHVDADGDDRYVSDAGERCSGAALDDGYLGSDPGTAPDCAPADASRWQVLAYTHVDADGDDRYVADAGERCSGAALDDGYLGSDPGTAPDCAPADASRWDARVAYVDEDRDGVGIAPGASVCVGAALDEGWAAVAGDCAAADATRWQLLPYTHRDQDLDGVTIADAGSVCAGAALPAGYRTSGSGDDCADLDATRWSLAPLFADGDGDGVGAGDATATCIGATVPAGQSLTGTDCAASDALAWRVLPYSHVDRDGDGATIAEPGLQCAGAAVTPPFYTAASGNDCDDADAALTRWVVLYADGDGDGAGTTPRQAHCLGETLPDGWSRRGDDVDDADPAAVEDEDDEALDLILDGAR